MIRAMIRGRATDRVLPSALFTRPNPTGVQQLTVSDLVLHGGKNPAYCVFKDNNAHMHT